MKHAADIDDPYMMDLVLFPARMRLLKGLDEAPL